MAHKMAAPGHPQRKDPKYPQYELVMQAALNKISAQGFQQNGWPVYYFCRAAKDFDVHLTTLNEWFKGHST